MEISRIKLTGIIVGSILVGMAIVIVGIAAWFYSHMVSDTPASFTIGGRQEKLVAKAPDIAENPEYLGTQAEIWGNFQNDRDQVLAAGDAQLTGKALWQNKPVAGLKLRLSLNEKVMTQWGTTDATGGYSVSIPPGRYKISGFEFDRPSANRVLAGKIMYPGRHMIAPQFNVSSGKAAEAIDFDFTDPVILTGPFGELPPDAKVVITWQAYPGAARYRVQLEEREHRSQLGSTQFMFPWSSRPVAPTNSLDISTTDAKLKPGYLYRARVEALDEKGHAISETPMRYDDPGFHLPKT
jgi:hypothetical protein